MRKFLSLLLAVMLLATLAACGGNNNATPSDTASPGNTTPEDSSSTSGANNTNDKPYAGTTLSVVVCTSAFIDHLASSLPEFEAETGIKVEMEQMQDSQVTNKVSVTCAAESGDVDVFGYRPLQESTLYSNNGWLEPLDSYVADSPEFDYVDFFQASRDATSEKGVAYGIPYMTEREILYLNNNLLASAGFTEAPKTMDELLEICQAVNDPAKGVYALALRGEGNAAVTQFAGFLYGFGGDFYDENGNATINTPEFLEAVKYYGMLVKDYCAPGSLNYGWTETSNLFCQGSAAIRIDCDSQYAYAIDPDSSIIADSVGYAMFPENGSNGSTPFNITAWALGINPYSQNKGAAWEFIKWATNKENDVQGMIAGNSSARTSTWENPKATGAYPEELLDVIIATNANPNSVSYDRPVMEEGTAARTYIGELITAAIEGASDEELQTMADDVNARVQALLDADGC